MLYVIANEISGSGAGAKALERVRTLLEEKGIEYRADVTAGPRDATRLADEAIRRGDNEIVCLGGDGTIYEIVNGIAGRPAVLYFVPCGTGNDFVKVLNLPKDPVEALEAQLNGKPKMIDVGQVNDSYFLNVSGSGFDAEVLKQATRFKKLGKGLLPYFLGVLAALRHFKPLTVERTENGETVKQDVTIFSIGNGRFIGGGMKAVPHAEADDGLFDVIFIDKVGKLKILKLLGKFIGGKHTELAIAKEWRTKEITVRCPEGMTVNIDGELVDMTEAHYKVLAGALEIRLPESNS